MADQWPKKQSVSGYLKQWYMPGARCTKSVINDIRGENLPGGQEPSGRWYIWVWSDGSPAHGFASHIDQDSKLTGNATADAILKKLGDVA